MEIFNHYIIPPFPKERKDEFSYNKGLDLFSQGKFEKSIEYFEDEEKSSNNSTLKAVCIFAQGVAYHHLYRYTQALECYQKVIGMENDMQAAQNEAYFNKGIVLANQEKYDDALTCFERYVEPYTGTGMSQDLMHIKSFLNKMLGNTRQANNYSEQIERKIEKQKQNLTSFE